MVTVTKTEFQNNFGNYFKAVQNGDTVVILENGIEAARLISHTQIPTPFTDSLIGMFKEENENFDEKRELEKALREKYELS